MANKVELSVFTPTRRRSPWAPFLLLVVPLLVSAAPAAEQLARYDVSRPAMGTQFRLTFFSNSSTQAEAAAEAAFQRIAALERICSDYLPESELSRFNRGELQELSADLFAVMEAGQRFASMTDGAFDITAGHYSQLWRRTKRKQVLPTEAQLAKVRPLVGWRLLNSNASQRRVQPAKAGMQVDLGGIGKGYAADAALAVLAQHGMRAATVAASGDLAVGDAPPDDPRGWPVVLRNFEEHHSNSEPLRLHLANCGVSTSGDLHQFIEIGGKRYSHIIDPATGLGLTQRISATVISANATSSDALATAVCIMGAAKSIERLATDHQLRVLTFADGDIKEVTSANWPLNGKQE
jgi:FAD:protein FMN transferase